MLRLYQYYPQNFFTAGLLATAPVWKLLRRAGINSCSPIYFLLKSAHIRNYFQSDMRENCMFSHLVCKKGIKRK